MEQDKFLPKKFSASDDLEDEGNLILQSLVRTNQAVKLILGGNDKTPNRDGLIELRNGEHAIGKIEVQVKPIDSKSKDQKPFYQLPAYLVGYSRSAGLPFILICYDRKSDRAYWKRVDDSLFDGVPEEQNSVRVFFEPSDEISNASGYSDKWLRINREHLEILANARKFSSAVSILNSEGGFSLPGLSDSPNRLAIIIQQIIDGSTTQFTARLETARSLFQSNEIQAAASIVIGLESEISASGKYVELLHKVQILLGNCYLRLENHEKAEEFFRAALQTDRASTKAIINLAHILYVRNQSRVEALALSREAYQLAEDDEFAVSTLILCLSFNNLYKELKELEKKKSSLVEKSSLVQLALAQVSKELENYSLARDYFKRSIELEPSNIHARIMHAEAIYKGIRKRATEKLNDNQLPDFAQFEPDFEIAFSEIKVAIEQLTKTSDKLALSRAYGLNAALKLIKGDFEGGLIDCEKVIAITPSHSSVSIIKAQLLLQLNRFEDVVALLEPIAGGNSAEVLQTLAYSHYQLGHYKQAADCFTSYIQDSNSDQEQIVYTKSLWLSGNKKKAYQIANTLRNLKRAPISIMRDIELKRLLEMQEWRGALDVLECLVEKDPSAAEHWLNRLAMNMHLNKKEAALEAYKSLPMELIESDGWARPRFSELKDELRRRKWLKEGSE